MTNRSASYLLPMRITQTMVVAKARKARLESLKKSLQRRVLVRHVVAQDQRSLRALRKILTVKPSTPLVMTEKKMRLI